MASVFMVVSFGKVSTRAPRWDNPRRLDRLERLDSSATDSTSVIASKTYSKVDKRRKDRGL
jgi:hypothetical protein